MSPHNPDIEPGYAVRHSRKPVSDFPRPSAHPGDTSDTESRNQVNYSVYAFPCLYPYGEGGIEAERSVPVSFAEHVRCNLHNCDTRFRTHPTWSFVMFSILQRRQALLGARIQTSRKDFDRAVALFSTLSLADLTAAAESEAKGIPSIDPKIVMLQRIIRSSGSKVMGSNASRASFRSQIFSTSLFLNPPSLWITINPVDLHDPIMQIFAGEEIDMDNFNTRFGPNAAQRSANVSRNPYAATMFFNFMITLILETLFGIKVNRRAQKIESSVGVFGRVNAYYGIVEAQGRGSLHLHMLVWLTGAPSSDEMHELLKSEAFRNRIVAYVDACMRADLDGLTKDTIPLIPREPELAWARPPDPSSNTYDHGLKDNERRLARSQQTHECRKTTCLLFRGPRSGYVCKRRAPFPTASQTTVDETGKVLVRRLYEYLNTWNPHILIYGRCNNDIKFLSNGHQARAVAFYVTHYATKGQKNTYNLCAYLAENLGYHYESSDHIDNARERTRLLIFRCLHVLNRQIEQSGQQVMSYLLGFGDHYCSHHYTPLFWSSVVTQLCQAFPLLRCAKIKYIIIAES